MKTVDLAVVNTFTRSIPGTCLKCLNHTGSRVETSLFAERQVISISEEVADSETCDDFGIVEVRCSVCDHLLVPESAAAPVVMPSMRLMLAALQALAEEAFEDTPALALARSVVSDAEFAGWRRERYEVHGCVRTAEGDVERVVEGEKAEFFTVYEVDTFGRSHALADFECRTDADELVSTIGGDL